MPFVETSYKKSGKCLWIYCTFACTNKPANFDSGGCSETWLRALIAEALPSITVQRYEKELKHPNELQEIFKIIFDFSRFALSESCKW